MVNNYSIKKKKKKNLVVLKVTSVCTSLEVCGVHLLLFYIVKFIIWGKSCIIACACLFQSMHQYCLAYLSLMNEICLASLFSFLVQKY